MDPRQDKPWGPTVEIKEEVRLSRVMAVILVLLLGPAPGKLSCDPAVTVRYAKIGDISAILDLIERNRPGVSTGEHGFLLSHVGMGELRRYIASETVLIAEVDADPIGFAVALDAYDYGDLEGAELNWSSACAAALHQQSQSLYLWLIGVHPGHQKRGVGKKLLEELDTIARRKGKNCIVADYMTAPQLNEGSRRFFERRGFAISGALSLSDYHGVGPSSYQIVSRTCGAHES
ncbi:MAG: GNAT family N-acetyltransferase [Bdellovibrionota bacterium]